MDAEAKKTALRTIPYGLYVLAAETPGGATAATVNWVTQCSFEPPLVSVKKDSAGHAILNAAGVFALSVLGKDQQDAAFAFFKPVERERDKIGGEVFRKGTRARPCSRVRSPHSSARS